MWQYDRPDFGRQVNENIVRKQTDSPYMRLCDKVSRHKGAHIKRERTPINPLKICRMSMDRIASLIKILDKGAKSFQSEDDPNTVAPKLAVLIAQLDTMLAALLSESENAHDTAASALYRRSVGDFASLQKALAPMRETLSDTRQFSRIVAETGQDVDITAKHMALIAGMDTALQHLVHLMQFDEPNRAAIDIRHGFQLTVGSVNYGRFAFPPPNIDSTNE